MHGHGEGHGEGHGDHGDHHVVTASVSVKGPIGLRLDVFAGNIAVTTGAAGKVSITAEGAAKEVRLVPYGDDRMEVEFDGRRKLRSGDVRIQLPPKSSVDLSTMSGNITVKGLGGEVRIRTVEGDIEVERATKLEARAVSGDVTARDVTGPVRIQSVAGSARVISGAGAPQLEFETTSGDLEWNGTCGKGCRLESSSMSGDIRLNLTKESSFDLRYKSHSGDLRDDLAMTVSRDKHGFGTSATARYGRGEGTIECQSFSGDLLVRHR
jgi:DUF4097 and DUF4098 domain-containing protein YvlB